MKAYCAFSLESPHLSDSNEYKQFTIFNMKKKNTLNYPKSADMGFFSKGFKNEFEIAVVYEPSVFEPLKFYCIYKQCFTCLIIILNCLHQDCVDIVILFCLQTQRGLQSVNDTGPVARPRHTAVTEFEPYQATSGPPAVFCQVD